LGGGGKGKTHPNHLKLFEVIREHRDVKKENQERRWDEKKRTRGGVNHKAVQLQLHGH